MSLRRLIPKWFYKRHKVRHEVSELASSSEEALRLKGGQNFQDLVALVIAFATKAGTDANAWANFRAICLRMGFNIPDTAENDFNLVRVEAVRVLAGQDPHLFAIQMRLRAEQFVNAHLLRGNSQGSTFL